MNAQSLVESDLITGVHRLSLYAKLVERDPSGHAEGSAAKELRSLLRAVQPEDLVIWGDWWRAAQKSTAVHTMPLPDQAMTYGLGLGWRARSAADRVLALAEARMAVREADSLKAEAVESLRAAEVYG